MRSEGVSLVERVQRSVGGDVSKFSHSATATTCSFEKCSFNVKFALIVGKRRQTKEKINHGLGEYVIMPVGASIRQ